MTARFTKMPTRIKLEIIVLVTLISGIAIAEILPANLGRGNPWVFRPKAGYTTANGDVIRVENNAGTEKFSVDIEGDVACNNLTVSGTFTLPATDFASGLTTTTITATGAAAFNAGLTVDSPAFVVANTTGALTTTGAMAANGGFSVDSPAFVVADTTGALTTTGAIAANGGISVDSPAWSVADTTGAMTTTGLANLNGGIAVDTSNFTVDGTSGAVVSASTIQGTTITATTGVVTGTMTASGIVHGLRQVIEAAGDTVLTAAQTGALVVNTKTSATTTLTLPAAAAGLEFIIVENGAATGEILITPAAGDAIKCKATVDGASVAPAAGTGIKNTAATNIVGDTITLVAYDGTTWHATAQMGTWASQ
jgi:hypothetical protein